MRHVQDVLLVQETLRTEHPCIERRVFGVGCLAWSVWCWECLELGVCCGVFGIGCLALGVWCGVFGVERLVLSVWCRAFGV